MAISDARRGYSYVREWREIHIRYKLTEIMGHNLLSLSEELLKLTSTQEI